MIARTATLYKTSFTGLSSQTWLLSLIMLVNRSGTMVLPFMTLYLTGKTMNRTLAEAGTVMGLFGLGSIVGAYFGGKFTDKIGFFKVQMYALLFGGILFIVLGQLKSFGSICLFTFLLSLVNESFRPANSAAIAHYSSNENRTRSYSLNRLAINLGWAVGASIGGLIATYNYELLFWVDGFTNIIAAVFLFIFLRPKRLELKPEAIEVEVPASQSAYRDKTYLWFIFLTTIFGFCFFQLFTIIPKYFRDNLFLSESYIGLIMAVNGLIIVGVEMVLVYILERKNKIIFFISFGTFICAAAFFSLLLPGNAKLISLFMILLITIGEIVAMPFMNSYWISRSNEKNRGQYAGLYTIAWGIGQTLGPFLSALLVDATNFSVLFVVLGTALIFTSVGFNKLTMPQK
ncbi:MFS transporter [Aurantibacillus circumpalustris]|uniref:MFS transporter n=1 Tax=Aurantibacillus circumpalustris TaxID=3036359 RepID=UPI00295BDD5A|nr:MFS transporter [Aurantibacillus circumpalustris]